MTIIIKHFILIYLDSVNDCKLHLCLQIKLPRLLQAVFAAFSDLYLFKFSCKLQNQDVGLWALFCHLTSWFTFYCATRTLTNSMETTLTIVALYYFPWPGKPRYRSRFVIFCSSNPTTKLFIV